MDLAAEAGPPPTPADEPAAGCTLRVIAINDVYELDNMPRLKTAIKQLRTANTVVLLAGDFLAPSLLSSLDAGRGMVDVMNNVGIEYVCFGNHEQDVAHRDMLKRIAESKFKWINTNAPTMPLDGVDCPAHCAVLAEGDGQKRKVEILGLNTGDPGLYTANAWGGAGAACIEHIVPCAKKWREMLLGEGADLVLPMTHQVMPLDREMAQECGADFPIIIGGHDHAPYLETVNGCVITKQGADAALVGVVDLTWASAETPGGAPEVKVKQIPVTEFEPDAECVALVESHKKVLKALDVAKLVILPACVHLSSTGIRLKQTTMGTVLCSAIREALMVDCAVINAGNIRGSTDYGNKPDITYADLKSEIPFESKVTVVPLPGKVVSEIVAFTRSFAAQSPPVEKGMYAQLDDGMDWSAGEQKVLTIGGQPLEEDKIYQVAVLYLVAMKGIDHVTPLANYCKEHANDPDFHNDEEAARGAKELLVEHFSRAVWWSVVKVAGFDEIDKDSSGTISRDELESAIKEYYGHALGDLVLTNLMSVADLDNSGVIDRKELLSGCFVSASMFVDANKDADGVLTLEEVREKLAATLGKAFDPTMVDSLFAKLDRDQGGTVTIREIKAFAKELAKSLTI